MKRLLMCLLILVGFGLAGCEEGEHEHRAYGYRYPYPIYPYGYPEYRGYPEHREYPEHRGYPERREYGERRERRLSDTTVQPEGASRVGTEAEGVSQAETTAQP